MINWNTPNRRQINSKVNHFFRRKSKRLRRRSPLKKTKTGSDKSNELEGYCEWAIPAEEEESFGQLMEGLLRDRSPGCKTPKTSIL